MTGKEALKLAQDTILAHNGNNKSSFTMKNLYLVEKELDKYEMAFVILKEKGIFKFKDDNRVYLYPEDCIWNGDFIEEEFINLTDEEYELLEELMTNENTK